MLNLTFGEQVKIVLSRKGMTIKELAEQIEERTGKKMSRQNLTQRLGRDNFQEQDMRMIAEILGCSFQLSILASIEAEKASVIEEQLPTEKELGKLAAKKEMKMHRDEKKKERDLTVGEYVEMLETPVTAMQEEAEVQHEAVQEEQMESQEAAVETPVEEVTAPVEEAETPVEEIEAPAEEAEVSVEEVAEPAEEAGTPEQVKTEPVRTEPARSQTISKKEEPSYSQDSKYFQPIKRRNDVEEDRELGDINPYTGREYQTNSVRMHPKRIGYVQVYDRKDHKWTDMTEWAFLGYEEQKKATLGKDYEPPIYLD